MSKTDRIDDVNDFIAKFEPQSVVQQSEAAKILKDYFRLSRMEIAGLLELTPRQVETRLVEWKNYAAKGLIPSGLFGPEWYQEAPAYTVVEDQVQRQARLDLNRETKAIATLSHFEDGLALSVAGMLHKERELKHIDSLYKELKKARPKTKRPEEVAVALQSDSHFGLLNQHFNLDIAKAANDRFVGKVISLTDLHRSEAPVTTLHYVLNGDNIQGSGSNYPNQRWSTNMTSVDQLETFIGIAVENIEKFLLAFDTVVVDAMPGNHGFIAPRKTSTEPEHANFETIAHRTLRWIFRNNPRVHFNLTDEWYNIIEIGGRQTLITHGHTIPGAGSLDGILSTFRRLQAILPYYDDVLLGHFHRTERLAMSRIFGSTAERTLRMNGTMVLGDEFSEKMGAAHTNEFWLYFNAEGRTSAEYVIPLYN